MGPSTAHNIGGGSAQSRARGRHLPCSRRQTSTRAAKAALPCLSATPLFTTLRFCQLKAFSPGKALERTSTLNTCPVAFGVRMEGPHTDQLNFLLGCLTIPAFLCFRARLGTFLLTISPCFLSSTGDTSSRLLMRMEDKAEPRSRPVHSPSRLKRIHHYSSQLLTYPLAPTRATSGQPPHLQTI